VDEGVAETACTADVGLAVGETVIDGTEVTVLVGVDVSVAPRAPVRGVGVDVSVAPRAPVRGVGVRVATRGVADGCVPTFRRRSASMSAALGVAVGGTVADV